MSLKHRMYWQAGGRSLVAWGQASWRCRPVAGDQPSCSHWVPVKSFCSLICFLRQKGSHVVQSPSLARSGAPLRPWTQWIANVTAGVALHGSVTFSCLTDLGELEPAELSPFVNAEEEGVRRPPQNHDLPACTISAKTLAGWCVHPTDSLPLDHRGIAEQGGDRICRLRRLGGFQ